MSQRNINFFSNRQGTEERNQILQYYERALDLQQNLTDIYTNIDQRRFRAARDLLQQIFVPALVNVNIKIDIKVRRAMTVDALDDLNLLIKRWQLVDRDSMDPRFNFPLEQWVRDHLTTLVSSLAWVEALLTPILRAQVALALGDHAYAVDEFGRAAHFLGGGWGLFPLCQTGNLPYTVDTETTVLYPNLFDDDSVFPRPVFTNEELLAASLIPDELHPVEHLFFRLQMGEAMLDWADALYKTADNSSVFRARELYKGIYYLHGSVPPINPSWGTPPTGSFISGDMNPAQISQFIRAQLSIMQIDAGLNFFGFPNDIVPIARYSTLKPTANAFAGSAKSTEADFLNAMDHIEGATIETLKTSTMLQRANLQANVAIEQVAIAMGQVQQAQIAIVQVQQQIAAMRSEIEDHDSFFGQLGDYFKGLKFFFTDLPEKQQTELTDTAGAAVKGKAAEGLLGIGVEPTLLVGFGAFFVASYLTFSSMADAQNERTTKLSSLENQNLRSARAQLDSAQRSVTIADLNGQISRADFELASRLLAFGQCSQLLVIGRYLLTAARYNFLRNIGRSLLEILKRRPLAIGIAGCDFYTKRTENVSIAAPFENVLQSMKGIL